MCHVCSTCTQLDRDSTCRTLHNVSALKAFSGDLCSVLKSIQEAMCDGGNGVVRLVVVVQSVSMSESSLLRRTQEPPNCSDREFLSDPFEHRVS